VLSSRAALPAFGIAAVNVRVLSIRSPIQPKPSRPKMLITGTALATRLAAVLGTERVVRP